MIYFIKFVLTKREKVCKIDFCFALPQFNIGL